MERSRDKGSRVIAAGVLLLVIILVLLLAKGLYPADLPESRNPDFVDNVFDNRAVLWAARLLLVSAAGVLAVGGIFIVLSIGVRVRMGEWLRRAGPFEISQEPVQQTEGEADFWRKAAIRSREETASLGKQLSRCRELFGYFEETG